VDACELTKAECLSGNAVLPGIIREVCEDVNIPWGHVSSGCIYSGRRQDGKGWAEEDEPNFSFRRPPCSFYSGTKALGEENIKKNFKSSIILRPSIIYGNGDNFFGLFSKISKFVPIIPIIGPNTMFQPVYVNDVSLAIIEALKINENKPKTYNICGPKQYSFYQLIKNLLLLLERKRILIKLNPKLMMLPGLFLQNLPNPPFTYDQMKLLLKDNVSDGLFPELKDLNIKPVLLDTKLKELIKFYN